MSNKILTSKIASPYAAALLDLAVSTHTVDFVTADINDLLELFETNEELTAYLSNPLYDAASKKSVLEKIIAPQFFNQNTTKFLVVKSQTLTCSLHCVLPSQARGKFAQI